MKEAACLILLNGELGDAGSVRRAAARCRGVVCADGGIKHCAATRIQPDFVVGDMDSLPHPLPRFRKKTMYWCDFAEDRSDFEKALEFAVGLGCRKVYVAGGWGGNPDHFLVNAAIAARLAGSLEIAFVGRGTSVCLGPGRRLIPLKKGRRFSLLAAPRARVTLAGARYGLEKELLEEGSRGLGNSALGPVSLDVHEGRVWLIVP